MNGAIPYFRIQEDIAKADEQKSGIGPEQAASAHLLLCEMAHQANNLLMRLQGWTSLLLLDVKADETGYSRLKLIEKQIDCGSVLTSQLLACAGRGVFADPVNIPPLLFATRDDSDTVAGENSVRPNLFIIADTTGRVRPGLLGVCRQITLRIAGVFSDIEKNLKHGPDSRFGKQYLLKARLVTWEGTRMANSVAAGFQSGRKKSALKHLQKKGPDQGPASLKLRAGV